MGKIEPPPNRRPQVECHPLLTFRWLAVVLTVVLVGRPVVVAAAAHTSPMLLGLALLRAGVCVVVALAALSILRRVFGLRPQSRCLVYSTVLVAAAVFVHWGIVIWPTSSDDVDGVFRRRLAEIDERVRSRPEPGAAGNENMAKLTELRSLVDGLGTGADPDSMMVFKTEVGKYLNAGHQALKATVEFNAAGGMAPETLRSPEDVRQRATLARTGRDLTQVFAAEVSSLPGRLSQGLMAKGISKRDASIQVRTFEREFKAPLLLRRAQVHEELWSTTIEALELLEREWGRWDCDVETQRLSFESGDAAATYNRILARYRAALAKQQRFGAIGKL